MKTRPKKSIIGEIKCDCGYEIPVKRSDTGTLDYSCQWCEATRYAKEGTGAHKDLMARVKMRAEPDPDPTHPEPVKEHVPPAEQKPAARAVRSALDYLGVSR